MERATQIQEMQSCPNNKPKELHIKTHYYKMAKSNIKEIILKALRENQLATCRRTPIKVSTDFKKKKLQTGGDDTTYSI